MMMHNREQPPANLSWSYCASLADSERNCACRNMSGPW